MSTESTDGPLFFYIFLLVVFIVSVLVILRLVKKQQKGNDNHLNHAQRDREEGLNLQKQILATQHEMVKELKKLNNKDN